jgi:pimeloyl-ACP methyl ester carboxylesterase
MKRRGAAAAMRALFTLLAVAVGLAAPPLLAQDRLGVILMHGKQDSPRAQGLQVIASNLESAGHKVVLPSMPWAQGGWEKISVTVEQVLAQIDGYVATLRNQGAGRIVVGGHSLGAAVALAYAVDRGNVAGLAMLAPGHQPAYTYRTDNDIRAAVDRAKALVDAGQGNQPLNGKDNNQGRLFTISTTAAVYYSWMNPQGRVAMHLQAPLLPASTPLMLVIGRQDVFFNRAEEVVYRPAARNPYSKYVVVNADHVQTPFAAAKQISDWINGLAQR